MTTSSTSFTSSCEQSPFSLLGFLLQPSPSLSSRIGHGEGDQSHLFRDYFVREINAFLWISLIAITALLLRKIFALLRLWAKGRRIPGPPCPSFYGHSKLISGDGSGDSLIGELLDFSCFFLLMFWCSSLVDLVLELGLWGEGVFFWWRLGELLLGLVG